MKDFFEFRSLSKDSALIYWLVPQLAIIIVVPVADPLLVSVGPLYFFLHFCL
jgi:hypothetical protein